MRNLFFCMKPIQQFFVFIKSLEISYQLYYVFTVLHFLCRKILNLLQLNEEMYPHYAGLTMQSVQ